ncbi:MAG: VOC family protein [Isosphaeraceae bacterium]
MIQWNPYLAFDGQCETAFRFYERCLGGKIVAMAPYGEMPSAEPAAPEHAGRIMHARLVAGDQVLMGGDAYPGYPHEGVKGCSVAIQVDTPEEAERLFRELGEGGTVGMPLQETFWAVRFGMLTDQFGVPWMINCEKGC